MMKRLIGFTLTASLIATGCGGSESTTEPPEEVTTPAGQETTAPATESEVSPEMQAILDGAAEEGQLTLIFGGGIFGGSEGVGALIDAFKEEYSDLGLEVTYTPGPSQGDMQTRVIQEYDADEPASTDVLNVTALPVVSLAEDGVVEAVDYESWATNVTPESIMLDGAAVLIQRWTLGVAYNTEAIGADSVPQTTDDLLNPDFDGRILTTSYLAGFDALLTDDGWGAEQTREYVEQFAPQVGGTARCSEIPRIATGEFDIFALVCSPTDTMRAAEDGAPVEFRILTDAAITYQNVLTVPSNSAHPNAAKLFVNWMLSPEAQQILRDIDFADNPYVEGSLTAQQIAEAEADGAQFLHADVEFYTKHGVDNILSTYGELIGIIQSETGE